MSVQRFEYPLPTHEEYDAAVEELVWQEHMVSPDALQGSIQRGVRVSPAYKNFMSTFVTSIGITLVEMDRMSESATEEGLAGSRIAIAGAAFGGLLVPKLHGDIAPLDSFALDLPETYESDDALHDRHVLASKLVHYAEKGLALAGEEAEQRIEGVESVVVPDVSKQRMFRIGCGVVIRAAWVAHEQYLHKTWLHQMEQQLDIPDLDWDEAFRRMTDEM